MWPREPQRSQSVNKHVLADVPCRPQGANYGLRASVRRNTIAYKGNFWIPWGPLRAHGDSIFEVNKKVKLDTQRSLCFCGPGVCFGLTSGRVGGAWEAVWTVQAWADSMFTIFQNTTGILDTVHHSLRKTLDLGGLGELIWVFLLRLLSIRAQILAYGCACRVHELSHGPRGPIRTQIFDQGSASWAPLCSLWPKRPTREPIC